MAPKTKTPWFIGKAIEATEIGYRVIANKLDEVLATKKVKQRIQAGAKRKDDSLQTAVAAWKQALPGLQTLTPLPHGHRIMPWSLGFLGQKCQREAYFSLDGLNVYDADPEIVPCLASGFVEGVFESLLDAICEDLKKTTKRWTVQAWEDRIITPIKNHHSAVIESLRNFRTADGELLFSTSGPAAVSHSGSVELFGPGEPAKVRGKATQSLTTAQYNTLYALIQAGTEGLSKVELVKRSKHTDAVGVLSRLSKTKPWSSVIRMPGKPGRGYRIV